MRVALLLVLVLALTGCEVSADPPAKPSSTAELVSLRSRMHARLSASLRMEQAIELGDLDRARAEARALAELTEPGAPPAWQPYLESIRTAARQIDATKDLVAAARATALLGDHCARCHAASSAKLVLASEPAPRDTRRLVAQMSSHEWAAARMWEGLIGPSDARWLDGARLLARSPLTITAESDQLGIAADAARVRLLAGRALTAAPADRAALYGDLLATCARCHYAIRDVRPTPSAPAD